MRTSNAGKSLIKSYEGLGPKFKSTGRIVAYLCPAKKPTIGYGHTRGVLHTDIGVREITMNQAEDLLESDLKASESYVSSLCSKLTSNQFDALVSLSFNVGGFGSTLTKKLRDGDLKSVPASMKQYVHATPGSEACKGRCGKAACKLRVEPGLITRRAAEITLFNTPPKAKGN